MSTIIPIFIQESPPRKCPHCGKEIPEEPLDAMTIMIGIFLVVGFVWVVITCFEWLFGFSGLSLVEVLQSQWHWLKSIRVW